MPMKPLLALSALVILAAVAVGCASPPPPQYADPGGARCRYEVALAMAAHQGRGVDGLVEGIIRETKLMALCRETSAARATEAAPGPSFSYCTDPSITNAALLAECRARGR